MLLTVEIDFIKSHLEPALFEIRILSFSDELNISCRWNPKMPHLFEQCSSVIAQPFEWSPHICHSKERK